MMLSNSARMLHIFVIDIRTENNKCLSVVVVFVVVVFFLFQLSTHDQSVKTWIRFNFDNLTSVREFEWKLKWTKTIFFLLNRKQNQIQNNKWFISFPSIQIRLVKMPHFFHFYFLALQSEMNSCEQSNAAYISIVIAHTAQMLCTSTGTEYERVQIKIEIITDTHFEIGRPLCHWASVYFRPLQIFLFVFILFPLQKFDSSFREQNDNSNNDKYYTQANQNKLLSFLISIMNWLIWMYMVYVQLKIRQHISLELNYVYLLHFCIRIQNLYKYIS